MVGCYLRMGSEKLIKSEEIWLGKGKLREDKTIVLERIGRQVQLEKTSRILAILNRREGKCKSLWLRGDSSSVLKPLLVLPLTGWVPSPVVAPESQQSIIHSPMPSVSNKSTLSLKQRKNFINAKLNDRTPWMAQIPQKSFALCCVSKPVLQVHRATTHWKNFLLRQQEESCAPHSMVVSCSAQHPPRAWVTGTAGPCR